MQQKIATPLTTTGLVAALVAAVFVTGMQPVSATERGDPTVQDRAERTLRDGAELTERAIRNGAEQAGQALREGADKIMRALELMMRSIPQYAAPQMSENGDIIIRRKNPKPAPPHQTPEGEEDGAST